MTAKSIVQNRQVYAGPAILMLYRRNRLPFFFPLMLS